MSEVSVKAILACDEKFGIGKHNTLPWPKNSDDLKEFRDLTTGHVVLMGSKTWFDPVFPKPLPNRKNYVITRNQELVLKDAFVINQNIKESIETLIEETKQEGKILWVIGGSEIFEMMIPYIEELHLTVFHEDYECNKFIKNPTDCGFIEHSFELRKDSTKYLFKAV